MYPRSVSVCAESMAVKCANTMVAMGLLVATVQAGARPLAHYGRAVDVIQRGWPDHELQVPSRVGFSLEHSRSSGIESCFGFAAGFGAGGGARQALASMVPPGLTAPTATAASSITASSFSANWNAATDATGYRLDVASDSIFTNFVAAHNGRDLGNVTTHAGSQFNAGTTYYYHVRAYNGSGTSSKSNTMDVTTLATAVTVSVAAATEFSFAQSTASR